MHTFVKDKAKLGKSRINYIDTIQKQTALLHNKLNKDELKNTYYACSSEPAILYNWISLQYSCMPWNDKLQTLQKFLTDYSTSYRRTQLITEHDSIQNRCIPKIFHDVLWKAQNYDAEFITHLKNRSITTDEFNLLTPEQQTHEIYGEQDSTRLFDATTNELLHLNIPRLNSIILDIFDDASKHSNNKSPVDVRCSTYIPLGKTLTTTNTKEKKLLHNCAFIGSLKFTNHEKRCREFTITSDAKTYELKHMILVLDIDNGKNFNKFLKAFQDPRLPIRPQMIIREKKTSPKPGNASALIFFQTPLTTEERKDIITGFCNFFASEYNLVGIDLQATGIGYYKNPVFREHSQLRRTSLFFVDNNSEVLTAYKDKKNAIEFFRNFNECHNMFSADIRTYMQQHSESKLYTYIQLRKAALSTITANTKTEFSNIFLDSVCNGSRHHQLSYEIPILLLQYYNHIGIDNLKTASPEFILDAELYYHTETESKSLSTSLFELFWKSVQDRYDLQCNNEITEKVVYKWMYTIAERDINNVKTDNVDFYKSLWYQHNIMLKYKISNIMLLLNIPFNKNDILLDSTQIPQFIRNEIITTKYTYGAIQRGADTNFMYGVFNSCKNYSEVLKKLGTTGAEFISEFIKSSIAQYRSTKNTHRANNFNLINTLNIAVKYLRNFVSSPKNLPGCLLDLPKFGKYNSNLIRITKVLTKFRRNGNVKAYNKNQYDKALNLYINMSLLQAKKHLKLLYYDISAMKLNAIQSNTTVLNSRNEITLQYNADLISKLISGDMNSINFINSSALKIAKSLIHISSIDISNAQKFKKLIKYLNTECITDINIALMIIKTVTLTNIDAKSTAISNHILQSILQDTCAEIMLDKFIYDSNLESSLNKLCYSQNSQSALQLLKNLYEITKNRDGINTLVNKLLPSIQSATKHVVSDISTTKNKDEITTYCITYTYNFLKGYLYKCCNLISPSEFEFTMNTLKYNIEDKNRFKLNEITDSFTDYFLVASIS